MVNSRFDFTCFSKKQIKICICGQSVKSGDSEIIVI